MWTIGIEFEFESAHRLTKVPDGHKCKQLHGHNYVVVVTCNSEVLDDRDFVTDYFDLLPIKKWINAELDHRYLNDVLDFETTVENLSQYIYKKWKSEIPSIQSITVRETPTTFCTYTE